MEKRISVHNPTGMLIYVGSDMVPAGETRDFPESAVPPHLRPQPAPQAPAADEPTLDLIADLQKLSVKEIVAALPDLSAEDMARLEELENADGSPRKGVMNALTEEKLKRAAGNDEAGSNKPAGEGGTNG